MIRAIVACTSTGVIAIGGRIPWRYAADFRHFKARTMGGVCIMGRKTFESIPPNKSGDVLPGRSIVVLSRDAARYMPHVRPRADGTGVGGTTSLPMAVRTEGCGDIWICGGGEVYAEAKRLDLVDEWDVTIVPEIRFGSIEEADGANVTRCDLDREWWRDDMEQEHDCEQPEGFAEAGLVRRVLRRRGEPMGLANARRALELGA